MLSIPFFSQLDPRWDQTLCATVSMAMALSYRGASVDPGKLEDWLWRHNGYFIGHNPFSPWAMATNYNGTHWLNYSGVGTLGNVEQISNDINSGQIIISMSKRFPIHWVIICGVSSDGTKAYYWDPWDATAKQRLVGDGWVNPGISTRVFTIPR